MKHTKKLLLLLSVSLASCGQQTTSVNPQQVENKLAQIISPEVQGQPRQELLSFLQSVPSNGEDIKKVIIIDVDNTSVSPLSLDKTFKVISSDSVDTDGYAIPFTKSTNAATQSSNGKMFMPANLSTCSDGATNGTGFYSRRTAIGKYAGFKSDIVLPTNFAAASTDNLYMYGSVFNIPTTQGIEIGLTWSQNRMKWVTYMSMNGIYPYASNTSSTYNAQGILLPSIGFDSGNTVPYKLTDFVDANDNNVFYVSANLNGTIVAYRYASTNNTIDPATGQRMIPPTSLNPRSGYSKIGFGALTSIANQGQSVTGSYMMGGQYANMQVINGVSNGTMNGVSSKDWTSSETQENCVSNTAKVTASNPVSTKIYTNIDLR